MENKKDKYSFRVNDPEVARILEEKRLTGEMSAYINEALRFYKDNRQVMTELKKELEDIKNILQNGISLKGPKKQEEEIDPVSEILINTLDTFS